MLPLLVSEYEVDQRVIGERNMLQPAAVMVFRGCVGHSYNGYTMVLLVVRDKRYSLRAESYFATEEAVVEFDHLVWLRSLEEDMSQMRRALDLDRRHLYRSFHVNGSTVELKTNRCKIISTKKIIVV